MGYPAPYLAGAAVGRSCQAIGAVRSPRVNHGVLRCVPIRGNHRWSVDSSAEMVTKGTVPFATAWKSLEVDPRRSGRLNSKQDQRQVGVHVGLQADMSRAVSAANSMHLLFSSVSQFPIYLSPGRRPTAAARGKRGKQQTRRIIRQPHPCQRTGMMEQAQRCGMLTRTHIPYMDPQANSHTPAFVSAHASVVDDLLMVSQGMLSSVKFRGHLAL